MVRTGAAGIRNTGTPRLVINDADKKSNIILELLDLEQRWI